MHLLVFHGSSKSGVVDSIPIAEVEILINGLVELAFSELLGILSQFLVVEVFWKILRETDRVLLG